MKKVLSVILALAMMFTLLAFAGCGKEDTTTDGGNGGNQQTGDQGGNQTGDNTQTGDQGGTSTEPDNQTGNQGSTDTGNQGNTDTGNTGDNTQTGDQGGTNTDPVPTPHTHTWDNGVVSKEATCGAEGVMLYSCACGEKTLESIAKKTEHTYDSGVVSGATKTYTCTVCGDQKTEKIEGVHEHEWANPTATKQPTCGEEGEMTFYCSCGETAKGTVRPTGNHTWNSQNVCTVCGEIKTSASPSDIH